MNGIQVLLITGIFLVAVYFFVRLQNSILDIMLLLLMVATALVFVLFPGLPMISPTGWAWVAELTWYFISVSLFSGL